MRRRSPIRAASEEAHINLTPLIDVVFVILITFIVVAPLLELERIELATGPSSAETTSVQERSPITLYVASDDTITLNKQSVSLAQLREYLVLAKRKYPQAHPQVFHDKNAKFGTYQNVKNAVEGAGFAEMDLILKPE